ncbi:aminotransferase class I/II-fold pyridoxal phosphate-dependent enzyme [Microbispora triticiradicis]|uniref:aminotransferase class I/II-fold pyridoxal phosphate-dependent enzyme n=1 Tax=Microbispora triticiradicis TaxID=2200763 RepID=UPI001AD6A0C5|nr:aminotransferase class I/II-fold pyridoxal phosphate-dependent enzyme [Microbispora triticiradicis]MBO4272202.1 aminotransferase class I/II-fold pyridoxal phosphate-dependent enzyme [Microbispora triticiradicis]
MDQSRVPVLEALAAYRKRGDLSFTPPGHKQGRGVDPRVLEIMGVDVFRDDVMVMNGLDDRLQTNGVLEEAQQLMAEAVNAEQAFFSTCGSSLSIKSAMLSVAGPGERLLVARNAHKSVISALILSGVEPVWVHGDWDGDLHMSYPPTPQAVEEAFRAAPDAKGVLVASPVDYGTCADLAGINEVCRRYGRTFIVDEAWGAHLPFHDDLPEWGMNIGADLCVTSVHKMGNGLEQSSVFHLQGNRVDPAVLKAREDLLGTTSPSTLIYAALDGWRRQMVEHGKDLLDRALELAASVRAEIGKMHGLWVLDKENTGAFDIDPLKLVIDVSGLGVDGYHASDWLREHCHVNLSLSDHRRVSAEITVADDDETVGVLLDALRTLSSARDLPSAAKIDVPEPGELELEVAMLPRDAFFGRVEIVPTGQAVGRIAAELVTPYPPGAPALCPGEIITEPVLSYLTTGLDGGMDIPDASDPTLKTLRVVAE